jgi:hypothetical protein
MAKSKKVNHRYGANDELIARLILTQFYRVPSPTEMADYLCESFKRKITRQGAARYYYRLKGFGFLTYNKRLKAYEVKQPIDPYFAYLAKKKGKR